jgi:Nucleotidyl transferase AbiEii toxin, Type IV TA system
MTRKTLRNVGASVRARLSQRARERKENVQLTLTRYAIERLLYRLSVSEYRDKFVLKGAMLFSLWTTTPYRSTGDLDLLGFGDADPERIAKAFREICTLNVEDDGVVFKPDTMRAELARPEDEYSGVRLYMNADISGARLLIQTDIGFGDAVTPEVQDIDYPAMLGMAAPHLRAYPPETVVAEKFQALVALAMINSRMKDFFDLWVISETFEFDGTVLGSAIRATFERRNTRLPAETPVALTSEFSESPAKQAQWRGFLQRTAIMHAPAPLPELLLAVTEFVMPPTRAIIGGTEFDQKWEAGGPWK